MCTVPNIQREALDPVRVDPSHYKVELENEKMRMLRVRYGPHEKSVLHRHPDCLEINLTVAHLSITHADGRKESIEARAGQARPVSACECLVENLSDFPYEAIALELK